MFPWFLTLHECYSTSLVYIYTHISYISYIVAYTNTIRVRFGQSSTVMSLVTFEDIQHLRGYIGTGPIIIFV